MYKHKYLQTYIIIYTIKYVFIHIHTIIYYCQMRDKIIERQTLKQVFLRDRRANKHWYSSSPSAMRSNSLPSSLDKPFKPFSKMPAWHSYYKENVLHLVGSWTNLSSRVDKLEQRKFRRQVRSAIGRDWEHETEPSFWDSRISIYFCDSDSWRRISCYS